MKECIGKIFRASPNESRAIFWSQAKYLADGRRFATRRKLSLSGEENSEFHFPPLLSLSLPLLNLYAQTEGWFFYLCVLSLSVSEWLSSSSTSRE